MVRGAVTSLYREPLKDSRVEGCHGGRLDRRREIAVADTSHQTRFESGLTLAPELGEMSADRPALGRSKQRRQDNHASLRLPRTSVRIDIGPQHGLDSCTRRRCVLEGIFRSRALRPVVERDRLQEQCFLTSERRVQARLGDAEGGGQIPDRCSFIPSLPEHLHRSTQGGIPIEFPGPSFHLGCRRCFHADKPIKSLTSSCKVPN